MAINIPMPDQTAGELFSKSYQASAVAQLASLEQLTSPRDHIVYSFTGEDAKFHGPDSSGPKSEGADSVASRRINIETMYKLMEFHDKHYDDVIGRRIISQIETKIPGLMARSLDKVPFGPEAITDAPFEGFTESSVTVDDTADSWLEVLSTHEATGYTPTGFLLDNSYKALVRKAFTEGSMVNPMTFGVQDGFAISGIPVYFRDLGRDSAGVPFGVLGQWDQGVLAVYDRFEDLEIHLPGQDWTLRKGNRIGAYAGWRVGFGVADQKAFLPIAAAPAV